MSEGESMDGYIYRERARAKAKLNEEKARLSYNANRRRVDKERGTLQDVINEYVGYIDRKVPLTEEEELDRDLAELDKHLEECRRSRKTEAELFSTMGDYPDMVNSPKHYEILPGVEVYDIREAILSKHPQLEPCVVDDWSRSWEYLTRMFSKNGLEDAKKARWYLNKLIERMENG